MFHVAVHTILKCLFLYIFCESDESDLKCYHPLFLNKTAKSLNLTFSFTITRGDKMKKVLDKAVNHFKKKEKILFLTTSNRWPGDKEKPKSTQLAEQIAKAVGQEKVTILDVPKLIIYNCEGNISRGAGNNCGVKAALLKSKEKNPSNNHRCWASFNNKDDELWKISKELFQSDCVVFFGSVRWGQMNAYYQKLIERLSWIENRHSTLQEENLLKNIDAGLMIVGQNWNGKNVVETQKQVLQFFGFNVVDVLCWNWQFTKDAEDESQKSYQAALPKFKQEVLSKIKKTKEN